MQQMYLPTFCVLFELTHSLIQPPNDVLSFKKTTEGSKLFSKDILYSQRQEIDNNQINDQYPNSLLWQRKQNPFLSQTHERVQKKYFEEYQRQFAKELYSVVSILQQKKVIFTIFSSQLLPLFIQNAQKYCFFDFFPKISDKSQLISLNVKELFNCIDNLNVKKQNCIFISDNPETGQMITNLDILFYEILQEEKEQNYLKVINCIKTIPSFVEKFINKRILVQTYKVSFPKPNAKSFQMMEIEHQADILRRFKEEPTHHLLYQIVSLSKKLFSSFSYRQIEQVALKQFMHLADNECLLQKIRQSLMKKGKLNYFPSLAGKIIHYKPDSCQIEIKFPTYQKYRKYMRNYEICRRILNVPEITNLRQEQLKVYQRFIYKTDHKRTEEQCLEFVDLLKNINENKQVSGLAVQKFEHFMPQMKGNINIFNTFVSGQMLNMQEIQVLIKKLKQLSEQIDKCAEAFLFRDINLTNILRQNETNKLFIVDFDNICYGPYILDICFILTDKYYYFDDLIVDAGLHHYTSLLSLHYETVLRDFSYCCYFMCVRWLIKLTNCYLSNQISFHMNLKALLVQLLRSFYRLSKFLVVQEIEQQKIIIVKLIKGFLGGYRSISRLQNLPSLPSKVILLYGPPYSGMSQISNILLDDYTTKPEVINTNQILIKLRKKSINKYYKINSTDYDYLFIFHAYDQKELNLKIQPNTVNKILLQNSEQKIQEFKKWYASTINQYSCIVCELFLQILGKSDKVVIVQTNWKEIWEELRVLLDGSTILIANSLKQHLFQRKIDQINEEVESGEQNFSIRKITDIQKYNENIQQKQRDIFSQYMSAYHSKNISLFKNYIMMSLQSSKYCAVILAAGQGSRYGYAHKALIEVNGKTLLQIWIQKLLSINITQIVIVDLKQRENKTIQVIQSKFPKKLKEIKLVCQQKALGPGDTLMQGLQKVSKEKVFTISCDTFSNLPISQLQYDENKVDGRMLVDESNKTGRYTLIQSNILSMIQDHPEQQAVTYGGIGCFSRPKLMSFSNQNIELIKNFGDILTKFVKSFKLEGIKLDENQYMHNINTQEDHNEACRFARGNR